MLCREGTTLCAVTEFEISITELNPCTVDPTAKFTVQDMGYVLNAPAKTQNVLIPAPDACGDFKLIGDPAFSFMTVVPNPNVPG